MFQHKERKDCASDLFRTQTDVEGQKTQLMNKNHSMMNQNMFPQKSKLTYKKDT